MDGNNIDKEELEEKERLFKVRKTNYDKIEKYFIKKSELLESHRHIPINEILANAPNYFGLIKVVDQVNSFISKDPDWLKNYVIRHNINFDWDMYARWKAGKLFVKKKYDDTKCPSKWIHLLQEKMLELIKAIQILLFIEQYITDKEFKIFLKKFSKVDMKRKLNYMKESPPSEDIDLILKVNDYLLKKNIEYNFTTNLAIDTVVCMQTYRHLEDSGLFELLKRKVFYVTYRLQYLKNFPPYDRNELPLEKELIAACEEFIKLNYDLNFSFGEYKSKLIDKYNKIKYKFSR